MTATNMAIPIPARGDQDNRALEILDAAKCLSISSDSDYSDAGNTLVRIKDLRQRFDALFDPGIKSAHEHHKQLIAEKKKRTAPLEEAENIIKAEMARWLSSKSVQAKDPPPKVEGVVLRDTWDFEIVDASRIPRIYLVPDIQKIRGVVQRLGAETRIPGIRVIPTKTIAARAAT